jgi:hypothetical protein
MVLSDHQARLDHKEVLELEESKDAKETLLDVRDQTALQDQTDKWDNQDQ